MALSRRTGSRFQASIWPGFVDAMTGLLLVLMFVLTIFMIVQFVLSETITGQETKLDALSTEVAALARALGLEQDKSATLSDRVGELTATLGDARERELQQSSLIAALQAARIEQDQALTAAQGRITSFEQQVAGLLADRDTALGQIADLETARASLLSEQETLQLALADLRGEIDAQTEVARLAAARREALETMIADLRRRNSEGEAKRAALSAEVTDLTSQLSEEEQNRLVEAAAAEALREKLKNAETELTAMTLALEEQRRNAEETLAMLAAAETAGDDLDLQLAAALLAQEDANLSLVQNAAKLSANEQEIASLQARLGEVETALQQTREAQSVAESDATGLIEEIASLEAELEALRDQLAKALAVNQTSETTASQSADKIAALTAELTRTNTELKLAQKRVTELLAAMKAAEVEAIDAQDVRKQLAAALAAKLAAETSAVTELTKAEERAALLAQAKDQLADQQDISAQAQRQQTLLNQQVAALREQLQGLQALLDDAKAREAAADVQLQTLGQDLNTALARVAAEERRRRELEEEKNRLLEAEKQNLEKYRSEFFGRLRDVLGGQEGVQIVGDRFVFSSEVLFAPGKARLSEDGEAEIAKVAGILRKLADDIPAEIDWVLRVDGHTDNVPIRGSAEFADNWELSQARALSVVRYMVNFLGMPPDRLSANGFGQYQPVDLADTAEARARNRRIELKFTEK